MSDLLLLLFYSCSGLISTWFSAKIQACLDHFLGLISVGFESIL